MTNLASVSSHQIETQRQSLGEVKTDSLIALPKGATAGSCPQNLSQLGEGDKKFYSKCSKRA